MVSPCGQEQVALRWRRRRRRQRRAGNAHATLVAVVFATAALFFIVIRDTVDAARAEAPGGVGGVAVTVAADVAAAAEADASARRATTVRGASAATAARLLARVDSGRFACLDAPAYEFSLERINDDYCDCPDGSDEPGTAACAGRAPAASALRFHCANRGYVPTDVPLSRVNDGVCDCDDGSDEWHSPTVCENKCEERGRAWRDGIAKQAAAVRGGLWARANLARGATAARERARVAVAHAEESAARAQQDERRAAATRAGAEAYARALGAGDNDSAAPGGGSVARTRHASAATGDDDDGSGGAGHTGDDNESDDKHERFIDASDGDDDDDDGEKEIRRIERDKHDDAGGTDTDTGNAVDDGRIGDATHAPPPHNGADRESAGAQASSSAGGADPDERDAAAAARRTALPMPTPSTFDECGSLAMPFAWRATHAVENAIVRAAARAHRAAAWLRGRGAGARLETAVRAPAIAALPSRGASWLHASLTMTTPQLTQLRRNVTACRRLASVAHDAALAKVRRARVERERARSTLAHVRDNKVDAALVALHGACFTLRTNDTHREYSVCPLDNVTQSAHDGARVLVGRFRDMAANGRAMHFDCGDQCRADAADRGARRATTVYLECGAQTKVLGVDEPIACTYEVRMACPAACSAQERARLDAMLRRARQLVGEEAANAAHDGARAHAQAHAEL